MKSSQYWKHMANKHTALEKISLKLPDPDKSAYCREVR